MNELLFTFLSFSPGPFWLILAFAPRHKFAMRLFDIYLIILISMFAVLTIPIVPQLLPIIANPKLTLIQQFLSSETGTVGTWNHMILGDLWIGRWVTHDSLQKNVSMYIRLPILITILFFGPVGLFFYLIYRTIILKKLWIYTDTKS